MTHVVRCGRRILIPRSEIERIAREGLPSLAGLTGGVRQGMNSPGEATTRVEAFIRELATQRFFGAVTVKFEAGRITIVKTERNYKPDELPVRPGDASNGR